MSVRFGAYEILYELKSGGMGAVLLGRRRGPGAFEQLVAIKTILPEYASAPAVRAMFLDEAAILARINHPGIATVHDFGEEGGTLYMVMEYVAGIPFREIAEHSPPATIAARAIAEACRGLHAAHEARDSAGHLMGLVHRDISPDNLMLGYDGHVKVIDFGIALVKNRQAPVTEFGTVKGKPPYMSPEQVKNEAMDRRSDVFSLAVVGWELLTGRPLFDGDSIYAIAIAVEQQALVPPSKQLGIALPTGLDAAIMGALDRDLARRTPTAAALAEQLESVLQVAGGETLEAWAERSLEAKRTAHRAWLAQVTAGPRLPKAVGRATGAVTELGAVAAPNVIPGEAVPIADPRPRAPSPGTSIGGDDLDRPPRSKLAPIVLLLLALLVGAIVVYVVATREHGEAPPPKLGDAAITRDTPLIVEPTPRDADVDAPDAPPDAPIDGPAKHHDARVTPHVDAHKTDVLAVIDATPTGSGLVTIRVSDATYLNVSIDGGNPQPPPINKRRLSAGKHTIHFHDIKTGDVVDSKTIEVKDGDNQIITH